MTPIETTLRLLAEARARGAGADEVQNILLALAGYLREALIRGDEESRRIVADILGREPRLASTQAEMAAIYAKERAFALTRSADLAVTKRVQEILAASEEAGEHATEAVAHAGDFGQAYADLVVRTSVASAASAALKAAVADPEVREVVPGFRFSAVGDADTRPNHLAADGLIAGTDDPIWAMFTPPLGHNCRCSLQLVKREDLARMGLIGPRGEVLRHYPPNFSNAHPDPGFSPGR